MAKCESCGADNRADAARCEYCDRPLGARTRLGLDWNAKSPRGPAAQGRAQLNAPAGADVGRIQDAILSAFTEAMDQVGPAAPREQLAAAMTEKLRAGLPPEHELVELEVSAVHLRPVGAGSGGDATGLLRLAGLPLVLASTCCLLFGAMGVWMQKEEQGYAERLRQARVVAAADLVAAPATEGLVCVEGERAELAQPLTLPDVEGRFLFLQEAEQSDSSSSQKTVKSGSKRWAQAFRLGGLEVQAVEATRFVGAKEVARRGSGSKTVVVSAIDADQPVTVMGTMKSGHLLAEEVAGLPTRDLVVAERIKTAQVGWVLSLLCGGVGLALLLFGLWLILRRR